MKRSDTTRLALVFAFALFLAGCGKGSGTSASAVTSSPGAGSGVQASISGPARTYVKAVCGAMTAWQDSIKRRTTDLTSNIAGLADLKTGRQLLVDYLKDLASDTHVLVQAVDSAGTPPVHNGDEARSKLVDSLKTLEDGFTRAATKAESLPTDDPTAFQKAVTKLGASISSASNVVSAAGNTPIPALDVAFEAEPACASIKNG